MMKVEKFMLIGDVLDHMYDCEVPDYVVGAGLSFLRIKYEDFLGHRKIVKVTIKDVIKYYAGDARNITSGIRRLGSAVGDWRNIDYMAKECLEYFKGVNVVKLRKEAKKHGLTPRF